MKTYIKTLIALSLTTIITFILIIGGVNYIINDIKNTQHKYRQHIGEQYVMNKDTVIIIDYSILNGGFILSNGKTVHYKLITDE